MAKKNKRISVFELVWYPICCAVILWGLTYFVLGLISKYNDLSSLDSFCNGFASMFKLDIQFWGLIIIAIGAVAGVIVMLAFAKTYDRAADREQRRSARLSALNKKEEKVVSEQQVEVVSEAPVEVPNQEEEKVVVEEVKEEPVEETKAEEAAPEAAPEQPAEQPEEAPKEEPAPEEKAE